MKKLTAGILASLIGLVSANSAEAAVASTKYVDDGLATKQQKLTSENFKADGTGQFISGVTVDANGNVTFATSSPEAITYDAALSDTSEKGVQNKVIKAALDLKQDTLKEANAGSGIKIANGVISADVTTDVLNTELAKKQNTFNWGENLTYDSTTNTVSATDTTYTTGTATAEGLTKLYTSTGNAADGTMTQAAITTELGNKQGNLTAGNGITLDAAGNIAAKAGEGITIDANGISADITQAEFDTALGNKQNTLKVGANIQIAEDGTISATDTTYTTATATADGLTKLYEGTGTATDGTMTQAAITTELGKKQNTLKVGANIQIAEDGTISATDTTYTTGTATAEGLTKLYTTTGTETNGTMTQAAITTELGKKQNTLTNTANAGTGITIDDTTGKISANNQLDAVTDDVADGAEGAQVLTRNCVDGVCSYVWEDIDRTFNAQ